VGGGGSGSHISLVGYGASGAYALGSDEEEEKEQALRFSLFCDCIEFFIGTLVCFFVSNVDDKLLEQTINIPS
jgi:hypothetical protein